MWIKVVMLIALKEIERMFDEGYSIERKAANNEEKDRPKS